MSRPSQNGAGAHLTDLAMGTGEAALSRQLPCGPGGTEDPAINQLQITEPIPRNP